MTNGARTLAVAALTAALMPAAAAAQQTVSAEENSRAVHAFLSAVDLSEVRMSVLAQERATNPEVKAFAGQMVTQHSQALHAREAQVAEDGEGLFEAQMSHGTNGAAAAPADSGHAGHGAAAGAAPFTEAQIEGMRAVLVEHPLSRTLANSSQANLTVLQGVNAGPGFDQTYMDAQIGAHRYALGQVDRMIAQGGVTDEMMATMRAMRAAIAQHLEQAQAIRGRL